MRWWPPKRFAPAVEAGAQQRRARRGARAEALARAALEAQGYRIERTNVRYPVGEIDLVAWEGATLCFVEVRSTGSLAWGGPLGSITRAKQARLIRAAQWYLAGCRTPPAETRFDVVAVLWGEGHEPSVELLRGAFDVND